MKIVRILCVDDNNLVVEGLTTRFRAEPGLAVAGVLGSADTLPEAAAAMNADIVLLDVDMPGRDPFDALAELSRQRPETRTIILSGHTRSDLIDRALACGAWGYLCKTAGADAVIRAIACVMADEFAFGPDLAADGLV